MAIPIDDGSLTGQRMTGVECKQTFEWKSESCVFPCLSATVPVGEAPNEQRGRSLAES